MDNWKDKVNNPGGGRVLANDVLYYVTCSLEAAAKIIVLR